MIVLGGLFVVVFASAARAETVKLFVLAGQSNAAGHGRAADLPEAYRGPREDVRFAYRVLPSTNSDGWTTLRPQPTKGPRGEILGPEIGFGHAMADAVKAAATGEHVAVVKFARGGANLREAFHPDASTGQKLYPAMIAFIREQADALRKAGHDVQFAGFLWYQGEADTTGTEEQARAYADHLKLLIGRVRKDLETPDLPFVAVRVNPKLERHKHREIVREAIVRVTEADAHAAWVDVDDLTMPDNLHLDAAGQLEAGRRLAEAYRKAAGAIAEETATRPAPAD